MTGTPSRYGFAIALAAVAVLAVTAVAPGPVDTATPPLAADGGASQTPAGDQHRAENRAGQAADCNYTALYDETITSVVQVRTADGLGSGYLFRTSDGTGYAVTNEHVVGNASEVVVRFARGEFRRGTVVGATAPTDLAVVRVNDTPGYVESLQLATGEPEPGARVAAFGSPFGLQGTMTAGIISGVGRSMPAERDEGGFVIPDSVQTDAPINPGNSGGPLVLCEEGTVVGVNRAGGAEDIGFAISADVLRRVVPALVENGSVEYAFLGVQTVEVTPPVARANDLPAARGLLVVDTVEGTPAARQLQGADRVANVSGVRVPVGGDVVLAVDGRTVDTAEDLQSYVLTEKRPGQTVELTVRRDGQRRNVTVALVERPTPGDE